MVCDCGGFQMASRPPLARPGSGGKKRGEAEDQLSRDVPRPPRLLYLGSSYSPSTSTVIVPSGAPLPLEVPFPFRPLSLPVPPAKLHLPSMLSNTPSFRVPELWVRP